MHELRRSRRRSCTMSAGTTACTLSGLGRRLVCALFFMASVLQRLTPGYRHPWFTRPIPLPSVIHPPSPAPEYLYLPARRIFGRSSAATTVAPPTRTHNHHPTPEEPGGEGPSTPQQPLANVVCHFPTIRQNRAGPGCHPRGRSARREQPCSMGPGSSPPSPSRVTSVYSFPLF